MMMSRLGLGITLADLQGQQISAPGYRRMQVVVLVKVTGRTECCNGGFGFLPWTFDNFFDPAYQLNDCITAL